MHRTTRGVQLDLSINDIPRGRQGRALTDALRTSVLTGALAPGSSLPSSRGLAEDLGVSRGMIVNVYSQLVAEGYLVSEPGGGTRTASAGPSQPRRRRSPISVIQVAGHNPGQPDPALFPRRDWIKATVAATNALPDAAFNYGDMRGLPQLRASLAGYLGRTRSIMTDPEQIVIVNGFAQTLACIVQLLQRRDPNAVIAVEDPGSSGAVTQLRWWGARLTHVRVDEFGLDVNALNRTKASAVIVTPAHQYPTGVTLSAERRHALVGWARRRDAIIIEDDYDADYRYDREPLTSLHALAPDHVIAAGSVSKSLSPGLRLGWVVAPPAHVSALAEIKANMDLGSAVLTQATLAEFIDNGSIDRHIRRARARYRARRDALTTTLHTCAPDLRVAGIAAGLHVLIHLDASRDSHDEIGVATAARQLGFVAQPLSRYRARPGPPGLVLGYAAMSVENIREAATALAGQLL